MRSIIKRSALALAVSVGVAAAATAQSIPVTGDITTSTTWTTGNTYNLVGQVYVKNFATLTIEPGVIIASNPADGGSLAVSRDARIEVNGTAAQPVIMTSTNDVATWAANDPKSGVWREACNEWGNLTLMGNGYVSENAQPGNVATPNANNEAQMEGLVAAFPGDPDVMYGGGDDDDSSGTIQYLSLRYGGKVIGLNNELNGLSLGGIGRGTDISHVEIMNNVDDGIEIWGGTVNLKYFSIWNIGDDSFDVDQGWRGKAQFGLIVQGYSCDDSQGSGVGDNCFETDGAEDSDWQPVTTTAIYNCTVVGQPVDGDGGTAWRDNARVQYHNCIFMDLGELLVRPDGDDGDGASGYGHNGTASWADHWTTPYSAYSTVNAPANPADFYQSQTSGMWCEIKDSVFFRNQHANAYTEATARGVMTGNDNVLAVDMPIKKLERGTPVTKGGKTMVPVTAIDPRADHDAVTSVGTAPHDGFFTQAAYRGAFNTTDIWLKGWTAADAFGFVKPDATCEFYCGAGTNMNTYTVSTGFVLGGTFQGTVGVSAPNVGAVISGYLGQLVFPIWGQQGLVDITKPEVMGLPSGFGASTVINWAVPAEHAYCGFHIYTQAAGFGGGQISLTCAYDCEAGY